MNVEAAEKRPSLKDREVSLSIFHDLLSQSSQPTLLMDLRHSSKLKADQLSHPNLKVVPFDLNTWKDRSFELPARHVPFALLVHPSNIPEAEAFLLGRKENTRKKRLVKPWKVTHVLLDSETLWKVARTLGLWASGSESSNESDGANHTHSLPLPRLWQPDTMVEEILLSQVNQLLSSNTPSSSPNLILDLASGAGRDVAFLTEELLARGQRAFQILALDHRYNTKELNTTSGFFRRRGISDYAKCVRTDLSHWETLQEQHFELEKVVALFAVRFWKPALVQALAESQQLSTGTLFGLSHFCKPSEGASWDFDHPSEKTVLERNHLSNLFAKNGWNIVHDDVALDSDHGRTMIHFVAQKSKKRSFSIDDTASRKK